MIEMEMSNKFDKKVSTPDYVPPEPVDVENKKDDRPVCFIMVGLPGSGKSSTARLIQQMHHEDRTLLVASSDAYIEAMAQKDGSTYKNSFEKHIKDATAAYEDTLKRAIFHKHDVIIDRTNVDKPSRKKLIDRFSQAGYFIICVVVTCDAEVLLARNEARVAIGRDISVNIIKSFAARFDHPNKEEGIDVIVEENTTPPDFEVQPESPSSGKTE